MVLLQHGAEITEQASSIFNEELRRNSKNNSLLPYLDILQIDIDSFYDENKTILEMTNNWVLSIPDEDIRAQFQGYINHDEINEMQEMCNEHLEKLSNALRESALKALYLFIESVQMVAEPDLQSLDSVLNQQTVPLLNGDQSEVQLIDILYSMPWANRKEVLNCIRQLPDFTDKIAQELVSGSNTGNTILAQATKDYLSQLANQPNIINNNNGIID